MLDTQYAIVYKIAPLGFYQPYIALCFLRLDPRLLVIPELVNSCYIYAMSECKAGGSHTSRVQRSAECDRSPRRAKKKERSSACRQFRHIERMVDHLCANAAYHTATLPNTRLNGTHAKMNGDSSMLSGWCEEPGISRFYILNTQDWISSLPPLLSVLLHLSLSPKLRIENLRLTISPRESEHFDLDYCRCISTSRAEYTSSPKI